MNENKTTIQFPIDLLDYDICLSCPELEIENQAMECYATDIKIYKNRLRCVHVERCRHLRDCLGTHEKHGL